MGWEGVCEDKDSVCARDCIARMKREQGEVKREISLSFSLSLCVCLSLSLSLSLFLCVCVCLSLALSSARSQCSSTNERTMVNDRTSLNPKTAKRAKRDRKQRTQPKQPKDNRTTIGLHFRRHHRFGGDGININLQFGAGPALLPLCGLLPLLWAALRPGTTALRVALVLLLC